MDETVTRKPLAELLCLVEDAFWYSSQYSASHVRGESNDARRDLSRTVKALTEYVREHEEEIIETVKALR